jgi:Uma2 family endonuclease
MFSRYSSHVTDRPERWIVDPDDPRAPPQELWDRMSEVERERIVESLPSEFEPTEANPPEGDHHTDAVYGARTALRRFFGKIGRRVYVGTNLPVYYPGESMFSPDVIAVLDVETHPRPSWIVSREGRGLDFAMEIIVLGHRRKDLDRNRARYAALGIREYFVFDRPRLRLYGFRLNAGTGAYEALTPVHGHFASEVLGLDLVLEGERLRFYVGDAELPEAGDLIEKLEGFVDDLESRLRRAEDGMKRLEDEARRAEDEARRAEDEARRADQAEALLREALAEIQRLKRAGA